MKTRLLVFSLAIAAIGLFAPSQEVSAGFCEQSPVKSGSYVNFEQNNRILARIKVHADCRNSPVVTHADGTQTQSSGIIHERTVRVWLIPPSAAPGRARSWGSVHFRVIRDQGRWPAVQTDWHARGGADQRLTIFPGANGVRVLLETRFYNGSIRQDNQNLRYVSR